MKKLVAVLTSVALVLGLVPAQGVSEALAEAAGLAAQGAPVELGGAEAMELGGATSGDALHSGGGAAIQGLRGPSGEDAAAQTSGEDAHSSAQASEEKGLKPILALESYDEENLAAHWVLSFEAPGHGLRSFELAAELPSADVDGDGRADFRDELSGAPSVSGISPDVAFDGVEGGFALTFKGGLAENRVEKTGRGGKSVKYPGRPTTIAFSTKVDPAWYASTGDVQDHTVHVRIEAADSEGKPATFDLSATAQVKNDKWTCEHNNPGRYTVDDTEGHTWHCGVCNYSETHEHSFEGTGNARVCACGVEGVRVSFGAGGGTGSIPDVWKAKGYMYALPACAFAAPEDMRFQSWQVRVGDGVAEQHPAGYVVTLTDATTVTAVWKEVNGVKYKGADGSQKNAPTYTVVGPSTTELKSGSTYVVQGEVDTTATRATQAIEVKGSGEVNLVLGRGARLKTAGIKVGAQATLNVFGQMDGAGVIQGIGDYAISNAGTLNVYDGTVTGASRSGILSDGALTLAGGIVTGNGRWGVEVGESVEFTTHPSTFNVRGNPVVAKNGAGGKTGVRLEGDQVVSLAGPLSNGARFVVHVDGTEPRTFTRGWRQHMDAVNPTSFFESSSGWLAVNRAPDASTGEGTFHKTVPYIDENGAEQRAADFTVIAESDTTLTNGWYAVREDVTIGSRVTVKGEVGLILCEGATLTCNGGIRLPAGNTLSVYGQKAGAEPTGKLVAKAGDRRAGIGGNDGENAGRLVVNGGRVEATGGKYAPGIGCGDTHSGNPNKLEEFRINDGMVVAQGGSEGAGIGTSDEAKDNASIVNIFGGRVEATGGWLAAGIGAGDGSKGRGAKVTVSGTAEVFAMGGEQAAGIGGGEDGSGGDLTVIGNNCSIRAIGMKGGRAVGRGDDGRSDGTVNLDRAPLLSARGNRAAPEEAGRRVNALRASQAQLEPCAHEGAVWSHDRGAHRRTCKYCLVDRADPEPHDWDLDRSPAGRATNRECRCGARLVRVCYDPGEGSGTMAADDEVVAGLDYTLPMPEGFVAPDKSNELEECLFYKWSLDGKEYDPGTTIVPSANVPITTVTALWRNTVPYTDKNGNPTKIANYKIVGSDTATWTSGWYVLMGNVSMTRNVTISGDVNLVLCKGAALDLASPLTVGEGSSLNIYGQPDGEGEIRSKNTVIYNNGSTTVYGGSLRSCEGGPDGVIKNMAEYDRYHIRTSYGELGVLGGTIQSDVACPCVVNDGVFGLGGSPQFKSRGAEDVYLANDTYIEILKTITYGTKVGVRLQGGTGVVTQGYKWYHSASSDPSTFFEARGSEANIGVFPEVVDGEVKIANCVPYFDENDVQRMCYDFKSAKPAGYKDGYYNKANYSSGWYLVDETLYLDRVNMSGDVNIILADDVTFSAQSGIYIPVGSSLTVWTQQKHTGALRAYSSSWSKPAINGVEPESGIPMTGEAYDVGKMGNVTIHGGDVYLLAGQRAAAMGDGDVRILGGKVVAEGRDGAMAIGRNSQKMTVTGTLEIYEDAMVYNSDRSTAQPVASNERLSACRGEYVRIEPCTHEGMSFVITETGHTKQCPHCLVGGSEEAHDLNSLGVCKVCGYKDPNGPAPSDVPSLKTMDLTLGDQIGLTMYYELPEMDGVDYSQSYVEFTVHDKTGQTQRADFNVQKKSRLGDFYGFTCDLLPMQMGSPITATLHFGNDGTIQDDDLSVAGYMDYFIDHESSYTAKERTLIRAVADYGHYIQPYLSLKDGWELGADYPVMGTWFTDSYDMDAVCAELQSHMAGASFSAWAIEEYDLELSIASDVTLDMYLIPRDNASIYATGRTLEESLWPEELEDGRLRIRMSHISMGKLDATLQVVGGDYKGDFWIEASPLSYAYQVVKSNLRSDVEKNAMAAMFKYWQAIKAYQAG